MVKAIPGRKKDPLLRDASEELEEAPSARGGEGMRKERVNKHVAGLLSSGVKCRQVPVELALEVSSVGDFVDGEQKACRIQKKTSSTALSGLKSSQRRKGTGDLHRGSHALRFIFR